MGAVFSSAAFHTPLVDAFHARFPARFIPVFHTPRALRVSYPRGLARFIPPVSLKRLGSNIQFHTPGRTRVSYLGAPQRFIPAFHTMKHQRLFHTPCDPLPYIWQRFPIKSGVSYPCSPKPRCAFHTPVSYPRFIPPFHSPLARGRVSYCEMGV